MNFFFALQCFFEQILPLSIYHMDSASANYPMSDPSWPLSNYGGIKSTLNLDIGTSGTYKIIDNDKRVKEILTELTELHEEEYVDSERFSVDQLTEIQFSQMRKQIVAMEIEIIDLDIKYKLSQNRTDNDYNSIIT